MHDAARFYAAWRAIVLAGGREVSDGIVRPEHRGPSPELAAFLRRWPGAWYWGDNQRTRLVLIRGTAPARPERWLWHGALLVLFIICTLGAGMIVSGRLHSPVHAGLGGAVTGAVEFAEFVVSGGWRSLVGGWEFALPLLGILLVHELGH